MPGQVFGLQVTALVRTLTLQVRVPVLNPDCRLWGAVVMGQVVGFLPSMWDTWIESLARGFDWPGPGLPGCLGKKLWDGSARSLSVSASQTHKFLN